MPSAYYGIPGNVVYPAAVNIASSTNASPIVVTTSSAHGLQTGDLADIQGHQVNTKANGVRTVTRTGANSFSINGSSGNGAGGATGTVQAINYGAGYNIPSDGTDARNAASVNVPFQALGDRSAADLVTLPVYKLASAVSTSVIGNAHPTIWMQGTGPANGFIQMTGMNGAATTYSFPGFISNDIAEVSLDTTASISSGSAGNITGRVTLLVGWQAYGTGASTVFQRPVKALSGPGSNTPNYLPLTLRTWEIAPNPLALDGSVGFQLFIAFYFDTFNATANINFIDDFLLTAKCWRPTGVPQ
jgi:hypothetical protein